MTTGPEEEGAYGRGHQAGEIAARLADHDRHFAKINGSINDLAREMHAVALGMQRLADSAAADRDTVITTAKALKEAEEARRDKTEQSWSPLARLLAVLVAVATVAGTAAALYAASR